MQQYLDLLLNMPLFRGIDDKKNLAWVLKCVDGNVKEYKAGDVIFEAGEDVYFAGMVLSGIVQMEEAGQNRNVDAAQLIPIYWDGEKSVKAVQRVLAKTDCRILFMRWIRLMKTCNFECAFHKQLLLNLEKMQQA